jgi:ribosome-associated protein
MPEEPAGPPSTPSEPEGARDVPVRDDGIRLGQLLKLADLVASGADAKALLLEGLVEVNGEVETRRGRRLSRGDVVRVGDQVARLV